MEREIEKLRFRMIQLRGAVRREKNGAGMPESKAVQTRRQALVKSGTASLCPPKGPDHIAAAPGDCELLPIVPGKFPGMISCALAPLPGGAGRRTTRQNEQLR